MRSNPIIRRLIKREGNKSVFQINGRQATQKEVLTLVRRFSIQIDNLCQFLPQDRVVEFAALSPVDLLRETQRAAAPEQMVQWHNQLKELRHDQKQLENQRGGEQDQLAKLEQRQASSREDVERMKERQDLLRKAEVLENIKPIVEFNLIKKRYKEAKTRRKVTAEELKQLEQEIGPTLEATDSKTLYRDQIKHVVDARKHLAGQEQAQVDRLVRRIADEQGAVTECEQKIKAEDDGEKARRQDIRRLQQTIADLKRQMEEPPIEVDEEGYNARLREIKATIRHKEREISTIQQSMNDMKIDLRQKLEAIRAKRAERANLDTQSGRQENVLKTVSHDSLKAWRWIQRNRDMFKDEIFGPALLTCTVTDTAFADAVETRLNNTDFGAITCTNNEDAKLLQRMLFGEQKLHNLSVRTAPKPLSYFRPPVEDPKQYGLDGWLLECIKGPEPVLAMLCDSSKLHQTAFKRNGRMSDAEYEVLQNSPISSWIAGRELFQINRRREYGASSTSVRQLKQARLFTNQSSGDDDKRQLDDDIAQIENYARTSKDRIKSLEDEKRQLENQKRELDDEYVRLPF